MIRKLISTTVLSAAVAGGIALAGSGTASAQNAKCEAAARNGTTAVLASAMCSGGAGSSDAGTREVPAPRGPSQVLVFDPDHEIDGPRYGGPRDSFVIVETGN